jgi:hypothetical protein
MIALRMVKLIETHSDELARGLMHKLNRSRRTSDLQRVPAYELHRRTYEIYSDLSNWLMNKTEGEIERTYTELARRRASQGVPFSTVFWAIISTKEHLWEFMQSERLADQVLDLFGELELVRMIDQFFDRALYYAARGYEQQQVRRVAAGANN